MADFDSFLLGRGLTGVLSHNLTSEHLSFLAPDQLVFLKISTSDRLLVCFNSSRFEPVVLSHIPTNATTVYPEPWYWSTACSIGWNMRQNTSKGSPFTPSWPWWSARLTDRLFVRFNSCRFEPVVCLIFKPVLHIPDPWYLSTTCSIGWKRKHIESGLKADCKMFITVSNYSDIQSV